MSRLGFARPVSMKLRCRVETPQLRDALGGARIGVGTDPETLPAGGGLGALPPQIRHGFVGYRRGRFVP